MKRDTLGMVILAISAALLLLACMVLPQSARADTVMKDRAYMMVTTPSQQGGEVLYVFDLTNNKVAVIEYDGGLGALVPRAAGPLADLVGGGPAPR